MKKLSFIIYMFYLFLFGIVRPVVHVATSPKAHAIGGAATFAVPAGAAAALASYKGFPLIDAWLKQRFPEKYGKLRDRMRAKVLDKIPEKYRAKVLRTARLAASVGVGGVVGITAGVVGAGLGYGIGGGRVKDKLEMQLKVRTLNKLLKEIEDIVLPETLDFNIELSDNPYGALAKKIDKAQRNYNELLKSEMNVSGELGFRFYDIITSKKDLLKDFSKRVFQELEKGVNKNNVKVLNILATDFEHVLKLLDKKEIREMIKPFFENNIEQFNVLTDEIVVSQGESKFLEKLGEAFNSMAFYPYANDLIKLIAENATVKNASDEGWPLKNEDDQFRQFLQMPKDSQGQVFVFNRDQAKDFVKDIEAGRITFNDNVNFIELCSRINKLKNKLNESLKTHSQSLFNFSSDPKKHTPDLFAFYSLPEILIEKIDAMKKDFAGLPKLFKPPLKEGSESMEGEEADVIQIDHLTFGSLNN